MDNKFQHVSSSRIFQIILKSFWNEGINERLFSNKLNGHRVVCGAFFFYIIFKDLTLIFRYTKYTLKFEICMSAMRRTWTLLGKTAQRHYVYNRKRLKWLPLSLHTFEIWYTHISTWFWGNSLSIWSFRRRYIIFSELGWYIFHAEYNFRSNWNLFILPIFDDWFVQPLRFCI